jgi:paraquat-inducible protein B
MSRRADPKLIGLFVLGAVAILVAALVVFGSGRLFVRSQTFVLFFQDDVAGLNVGAPVTFRGVRIGSVTNILIRYDSQSGRATVPVYITVQSGKVIVAENNNNNDEPDTPEALVAKGLRAQLRTQSFVTGLLAVNLDFEPGMPPMLVGADPRYPEIPTVRSSIAELRSTFSDVVADFRKLPLGEMIQQMAVSARNLDKLVNDTDVLIVNVNGRLDETLREMPPALKSISQAAQDVSRLTRNVDQGVPAIRDGAVEAIGRLNETLAEVQKTMNGIQSAVGDASPLQSQMNRTLSDIGDAAIAVRTLAEYLNQNPRALLTGRGKDSNDDGR